MARIGPVGGWSEQFAVAGRLLPALLISAVLHFALIACCGEFERGSNMLARLNDGNALQAVLRGVEGDPSVSEGQFSPSDTLSSEARPLAAEAAVADPPPADRLPDPLTNGSPTSQQADDAHGEASGDAYWPADQVSVAAVPVRDIDISWSSQIPKIGVFRGIFTLFIDENGRVTRILPDAHSLPPGIEEAAIKSFMATPFRPALRGGRPVRSMKRVEVVSEYRPVENKKTQDEVTVTGSQPIE